MRSFKKVVASVVLFILFLSLTSGLFIGLYFSKFAYFDTDLGYRDELSGSLDFLVVGSSATKRGFIPEIIDDKLSVSSYNLSGSYVSPSGKQALIEEEIDRNQINTIVLEVSNEDLGYSGKVSKDEGEIYLLPRMTDAKKRCRYFFNNVRFESYMYFYGVYLNNGVSILKDMLLSDKSEKQNLSKAAGANGFYESGKNNLFLSDDDIVSSYKTGTLTNFEKNTNYEKIAEIIKECQSKNIEVVLVTIPVAEMRIWQKCLYDEMNQIINDLANEYGCAYLDFNLIKNRNQILNDRYSFSDYGHLSTDGATAFTSRFCDIMKKLQNGEDVSDMFYDSYEEAITHFEYYNIYQKLTQEK